MRSVVGKIVHVLWAPEEGAYVTMIDGIGFRGCVHFHWDETKALQFNDRMEAGWMASKLNEQNQTSSSKKYNVEPVESIVYVREST